MKHRILLLGALLVCCFSAAFGQREVPSPTMTTQAADPDSLVFYVDLGDSVEVTFSSTTVVVESPKELEAFIDKYKVAELSSKTVLYIYAGTPQGTLNAILEVVKENNLAPVQFSYQE